MVVISLLSVVSLVAALHEGSLSALSLQLSPKVSIELTLRVLDDLRVGETATQVGVPSGEQGPSQCPPQPLCLAYSQEY